MFKKLRYRLLSMNLIIISILMVISFSSIYLITHNNIYSSINLDLYRISDFKKIDFQDPHKPTDTNFTEAKPFEDNSNNFIPERTVSFTILTDSSNEILFVESFFESNDEFYQTALEFTLASDKNTGHFSLDGNEWAFLKTDSTEGQIYAFLDITAQQNVLNRLIYTFLIVFAVMFFIIFFISNFLTNRSIKPIKDAFEKQKLFISDASHELKTPLAVINTNVDVLLSNQDNDNKKWLTYIKSEVERMSHLTNDLLYLTQVENTSYDVLLKNRFELNDKIESLLLGLDAIVYEKNILLEYEMPPDIYVYGNPEQLTQVVMILLDNAIKYTPEDGHIKLLLKQTNHHIYLIVENTGEGIPAEDIHHVFDRFYRVDKVRSRATGSYGLGLPIAKAIVEQHGGKITCESILNANTTFTVKLPNK